MSKAPFITIDGRKIGSDFPPYIIAELSANHNKSLDRAINIISQAKKCGSDAVKLQTYTHDTITMDCDNDDFQINDGLWRGQTLYELYKDAHMPWGWHKSLFDHAKKLDITIFSSPFDNTAIDLLEDLNTPAYKIASFEAIDLPLISYAAQTKKPMIISTGMASKEEIEEAVNVAQENGCKELAILLCVSAYPSPPKDYNLNTITDMIDHFGLVTGLSDHTIENTTAITSIALGSSLIEKHFTLNRNDGGPDDSFSLEPKEMSNLCRDSKIAWEALGNVNYNVKSSEIGNIKYRRSIYFVKDIEKGEIILSEHIRSIRPGFGIAPQHYNKIVGKRVIRNINAGTATDFDDIE